MIGMIGEHVKDNMALVEKFYTRDKLNKLSPYLLSSAATVVVFGLLG